MLVQKKVPEREERENRHSVLLYLQGIAYAMPVLLLGKELKRNLMA